MLESGLLSEGSCSSTLCSVTAWRCFKIVLFFAHDFTRQDIPTLLHPYNTDLGHLSDSYVRKNNNEDCVRTHLTCMFPPMHAGCVRTLKQVAR